MYLVIKVIEHFVQGYSVKKNSSNGTIIYQYPWDGKNPIKQNYELSNTLNNMNGIIIFLAFLTGVLLVLLFGVGLFIYRKEPELRSGSITFMYFILAGSALVFISHLEYLGQNTAIKCRSQFGLELIGLAIILGSYFLKEFRVYMVLRIRTLSRKWIQDELFILYLLIIVGVQIVINYVSFQYLY
jgi:hypothetical protein